MTKHLIALVLPFALLACKQDSPSNPAPPATKPADAGKVQIAVTENGFEPASVTVPAATPVTLVFTRKTDATCAKQVVLTMADGTKVEKDLPLGTPVELAATFPKAGTLGYACGMDMEHGTIVVQ